MLFHETLALVLPATFANFLHIPTAGHWSGFRPGHFLNSHPLIGFSPLRISLWKWSHSEMYLFYKSMTYLHHSMQFSFMAFVSMSHFEICLLCVFFRNTYLITSVTIVWWLSYLCYLCSSFKNISLQSIFPECYLTDQSHFLANTVDGRKMLWLQFSP